MKDTIVGVAALLGSWAFVVLIAMSIVGLLVKMFK